MTSLCTPYTHSNTQIAPSRVRVLRCMISVADIFFKTGREGKGTTAESVTSEYPTTMPRVLKWLLKGVSRPLRDFVEPLSCAFIAKITSFFASPAASSGSSHIYCTRGAATAPHSTVTSTSWGERYCVMDCESDSPCMLLNGKRCTSEPKKVLSEVLYHTYTAALRHHNSPAVDGRRRRKTF